MRLRLIVNDAAGDRVPNSSRIAEIDSLLRPAGVACEAEEVRPDSDVRAMAARAVEAGFDGVVVAGGDGTVSLAASALVKTSLILGILPMGTFNNIARSLHIPNDLTAACAIIAAKKNRAIDVGRIGGAGDYFFEAAGCGLDAALFPLGEKIKGGRWSNIIRFARLTMRYNARRMHLSFDCPLHQAIPSSRQHRYSRRTLAGHSLTVRALLVPVANGPYYGGGFTIAPDARMDDGLLTIAVYRRFSKLELLRHFWSISRCQHKYSPKIEVFHAAKVEITSARPHPVHVDGRPRGSTPIVLHAVPGALRVFAPCRADA